MLKKDQLIVLWGDKTNTLTVGLTRRCGGYDVVASASGDAVRITRDCPKAWQKKVADAWFILQRGDRTEVNCVSTLATHELEPPHFHNVRPIPLAEVKP